MFVHESAFAVRLFTRCGARSSSPNQSASRPIGSRGVNPRSRRGSLSVLKPARSRR